MASLDPRKVYRIVNVKTGKVLDVANDHNKSIVGSDGQNHLWCVKPQGPTWSVRVLGQPLCLGLAAEPEYHDPVIATCYHTDQYHWSIHPADDGDPAVYRIWLCTALNPQTTYHLELTWPGADPNAAQFRPVQLQRKYKHGAQLWRFEVVGAL